MDPMLLQKLIGALPDPWPHSRTILKHAFSNIETISPSKTEKKNQIKKNSDIFHISAQNIDCGYSLEPPWRGGSNKYPLSMFLSINKKNNVYPVKTNFYCVKVGFKGVKIIQACFRDESQGSSVSTKTDRSAPYP